MKWLDRSAFLCPISLLPRVHMCLCKEEKQVGITLCPSLDRLHDVLMELQKKQLQQLSAWLTLTEERIQKMETCPLEDDLKSLQKLLEDHKVNLAHISFIPYQIGKSST